MSDQVEYEIKRAEFFAQKAGVRGIMRMDEIEVIEAHRQAFSSSQFPFNIEINDLPNGGLCIGAEIEGAKIMMGRPQDSNHEIDKLRFELCVMAYLAYFKANKGDYNRDFYCF